MKKDLPNLETIASLDRWGSRKAMIPLDAKGKWQRRKVWLQWILLVIFLILPFIKINSNPAILLNIGERKFSFFGFLFFAHDAPLVFFILAFSALLLIVATSIWGRVWCGYACPQTVFIERIYRNIEKLVEGSPIERRKRLGKPLDPPTAIRLSIKWVLFFVVSSLFAHAFAAYFVGAESILSMVTQSPSENWTTFLVVTSITALLLFDFGWFREQFCIIMCPYGRFQSVLMDDYSLAIIYDEQRGEPRKGAAGDKPAGDCVNCFRCVEVCPTGIDIRQGVQMECIACTACIDACDEIMEKVKKPAGLIRYDNAARAPLNILKPRNLIYFAILGILMFVFIFILMSRNEIHIALLRAKDLPYQTLPSGEILNHFRLHIKNQSAKPQRLNLRIEPSSVKLVTQINPVIVGEHRDLMVHFFTNFSEEILRDGSSRAVIEVRDFSTSDLMYSKELILLGPKKSEP